MRHHHLIACIGLIALLLPLPAGAQAKDTCQECHAALDPPLQVTSERFTQDIHAQKGLTCASCHGGDPTSEDPERAMSRAAGFRGKIERRQIPALCARCHADAAYMKSYAIPTDQMAGYSASVHYEALAVRGDLSAPTCTTCHGNHGAAPPGVASVEFVCATCHVFQAQLFDTSPHKAAFAAMGLGACVTCHSNHRIQHPSDAMIGTGKDAVCLNCHAEGDAGFAAAARMHGRLKELEGAIEQSEVLLARAERSGMEVGQAKLEQSQARDALTKARVTIHSFNVERLEADVQEGLKVARSTLKAGQAALVERDYRRIGLGVSLLTIVVVLLALRRYIRKVEAPAPSRE